MKTETWIKTSERAPTEADLPVWVFFANDKSDRGPHLLDGVPAVVGFTHWRPAKDDVPEPPREEAQADRDENALSRWATGRSIVDAFAMRATWHAALAYERAEVAKMRPDTDYASWDTLNRATSAIRARCNGGGK